MKAWVHFKIKILVAIFSLTILVLAGGFYYLHFKASDFQKICPEGVGRYLLPRTFIQKDLFLGYDEDPYHLGFLRSAVNSVIEQELKVEVNILIPRSDLNSAYEELSPFRRRPYNKYVHLLLAPTDSSLWVQDYLESSVDLETGESVLFELPYWGRDGEEMPKFVALNQRWEMVNAPDYPEGETHDNGDYGGNIEALPYGFILVGEDMAPTLKRHLKKEAPQQSLIEVPVGWLENGHVDEVFTLLPNPKSKCGFSIGYASPKMALEIIRQSPPTDELLLPKYDEEEFKELDELEPPPEKIFASCFKPQNILQCQQLLRANKVYQQKIEEGLERIKQALNPKCEGIKYLPLPQLYMPNQMQNEYGTLFDLANAVNPNLVNTLLIGKHIYYSWQPYSEFAKYAYNIYQSEGLVPRPTVTNILHHAKGGLHCASLMSHSCESKNSGD